VLQGSLLGGAVIARLLQTHTEVSAAQTTYLRMYGEQLGGVWKRFTTALDDYGIRASDAERDQAIDAARDTFGAFSAASSAENRA